MKTQSRLIAATLCATVSMVRAKWAFTGHGRERQTGVESTAPNNPPIATAGGRRPDCAVRPNHKTSGQAPNVSKKIGAEIDFGLFVEYEWAGIRARRLSGDVFHHALGRLAYRQWLTTPKLVSDSTGAGVA